MLAASIIAASSETGMNAPLMPPTALDAIAPPFLTASVSRASAAVVPGAPARSNPNASMIFADRIAGHGRRRKRQIDDAELQTETPRRFAPDQFTGARELERESLDDLGHLVERQVLRGVAQRVIDDAGAGDADVDDRLRFADAVKRARHERVVLDRVGEADELRARDAAARRACARRRL